MITSVLAPVAGATGTASDEGVLEEEFDVSEREHGDADNRTHDDGDVVIDEAMADAEGTTEVIVRIEEVDLQLFGARSDADVAAGLKAHAAESQAPVLEYIDETEGLETKNTFWLTNAVLVEVDTDAVDVTELAARSGVAEIHENYRLETPEPASFDAADDESDTTYGLDQTNATEVWDEYDTMGEGVSVAVLDTGVDADHPDIDIDPANWAEFDGSGDRIDSEPHDTGYHGTHVSGTVAGGNASGTHIGVAPEAELMHGLVLPDGGGSFAQIIGGMEWAVDEDADVVSMSLGAGGYHADMIEPVRNAYDAGTVVVSSSGNDGEDTSGSPGNVYEAFSVGASAEDESIADFSSGERIDTAQAWGVAAPDDWPDEYVVPDVSAPGDEVLSAVPSGTFDDPDELWGSASGTSMAAPHVSGALALALAATDDELTTEQVEALFENTAWKPDGEPNEQDTRYGHGLIDAKAAIDRVAADGGVEGTVTSESGDPIGDATVVLDGFPVTTDDDGTYTVRAGAGEYELEADAFGYESTSVTVDVSDGEFTDRDIELAPELDVELRADQPRSVQAGDSFEVVAETAHLETYTVEIEGYDADDATLSVDGEEVEFGEPVEFDGTHTGTVEVSVGTSAGTAGDIELHHTFGGTDDELETTTGPTGLFDEPTTVGVVTPDGETGSLLEGYLAETLDVQYQLEDVSVEDAVNRADDGTYDVYVVQRLGDEADLIEDFVEATDSPEIGVLYLEQIEQPVTAIADRSAATENPRTVQNYATELSNGPINYEIESSHPIFDGVAAEGETVELYTPEPVGVVGHLHASFEDFSGDVHSENLATTSYGSFFGEETGTGMAVENNSRTVLAASLVPSSFVGSDAFTPEATQTLANAVEFASTPPGAHLDDAQEQRVDPGESMTVTVSAENLDRLKTDVVGGTLAEDDLSLYVDGSVNAFGEYRSFEEPRDVDELEITVVADEDAVGSYELEHTFVTEDEDGTDGHTAVRSGTTAVYEAPLDVGTDGDLEALEGALEIVPEGSEIVLEDGVYEHIEDTDDFFDPAYILDTDGVTIRAAEDASPAVTFEGSGSVSMNVFDVQAHDVTLDGLRINADEDGDIFDGGSGVLVDGYEGLTITNSTIAGERGVKFEEADDLTLRDTAFTEANSASILTDNGLNENVLIDNVTIDDVQDFGLYSDVEIVASENVTIQNSDVRGEILVDTTLDATITDNTLDGNGDRALHFMSEGHVADNTVTNATAAIDFNGWQFAATIVDNYVEDSETGIRIVDDADSATVTGNEIHADEGITFEAFAGDFNTEGTVTDVYYNDLSGSDLAFVADETQDDAEIDVRYNYAGGDAPATDGNLVHAPYLTEAPHGEMPPRDELAQLGVDLQFEAGETYAIGVPGPTTQTVSDLFDDDFEGVAYGFDADEQAWDQLTQNDGLDALEAVVVVADVDGHAHLEFTSDDAPSSPGQASLSEGWNFVAPPTYSGVDGAFEHATTDVSLVMHSTDRPAGQIAPAGDLDGLYTGDDDPRVSPFEGYFVFADDDGVLPAHLASDPTTAQLYDSLDATDHLEIDGSDAVPSSDAVADVLASGLEGDDLERALVAAVDAEFRAELDENASTEEALNAIETVRNDALDDTDGNEEIVEDAVQTATRLLLDREFDIDTPPRADGNEGIDTSTALSQPATVVPAASG